MARRYTSSQIRSKLRQAQQKQRQAINRYNQAVRRHNQQVKTAVNKYNQQVRIHNARVRANRQRLRTELTRLKRKPTTTRYVTYRTSVMTLYESYTRLEHRAASPPLDPIYNRFLDLSERETANSLEVTNRLFGSDADSEQHSDALENKELLDNLRKVAPGLDDRWQGAVFALNPRNPDAARHFCTSAREIIAHILEIKAPDSDVIRLFPDCDTTDQGKPTRRAKIKFFLHHNSITENALEEFVEQDMENIVQLFHVLNRGTHGSVGAFDFPQLTAIRKRVEDGIVFLTEIIGSI